MDFDHLLNHGKPKRLFVFELLLRFIRFVVVIQVLVDVLCDCVYNALHSRLVALSEVSDVYLET